MKISPSNIDYADDMKTPTTKKVEMLDLYQEFGEMAQKHKISKWLSKGVQRKYAFELPNVPSEATYLKVAYSFSSECLFFFGCVFAPPLFLLKSRPVVPTLPSELTGKTFSRIFGTNTSPLELFIMKRKLMGPCWLVIENCVESSVKSSWCKIEVSVESQKSVKVDDKATENPPLTVMSLSVKTIMNQKQNVNEIVALSAVVHSSGSGSTLLPTFSWHMLTPFLSASS